MVKKVILAILGLATGVGLAYLAINYRDKLPRIVVSPIPEVNGPVQPAKHEVVGFLPYWLLDKAGSDYSKYITTLTYFGLTLDGDGRVVKFNNPGEAEPGWYALTSGKFDNFASRARDNHIKLSLLVFSGNTDTIQTMMNDPINSANNLLSEVGPLMSQYGFSDLNLDIEDVALASDSARVNFLQFAQTVKKGLGANTLTVEVTSGDAVNNKLIDVAQVSQVADQIVIMAYDYHFSGSMVTGPVSPNLLGGDVYEYDVKTALEQTLKKAPASKVILGIPLYGYEWETLSEASSSAVIPGSGQVASSARVQELLKSCDNCKVATDSAIGETYVVFKNTDTGTFQQIFYPDAAATAAKVDLSIKENLGGIGLWALGYEDDKILGPLQSLRQK